MYEMHTKRISLVQAMFIRVPTEHPMHYRPYESRLDTRTVNQVAEVTRGGACVNSNLLTGVSSQILSPSDQSKGIVHVPSGWHQDRYSVILKFIAESPAGTYEYTFSGYTNYNGIGRTGALDPEMAIYLNSNMVTTKIYRGNASAHGVPAVSTVAANHLLSPVPVTDTYTGETNTTNVAMRPSDVFAELQRTESAITNGAGVFMDSRNVIGDFVGKVGDRDIRYRHSTHVDSSVNNLVPNKYVAKVLSGYSNAIMGDPMLVDVPSSSFGNAHAIVDDTTSAVDVFFNRLVAETNWEREHCVRVGELGSLWPEIYDDRITKVIEPQVGIPRTTTDTCEEWGGSTKEKQTAHLIVLAVAAIMANNKLKRLDFTLTNRTIDGQPYTTIPKYSFLQEGLPQEWYLSRADTEIKTDLLGQITSNGIGDFYIDVSADLYINCKIKISLNGGPLIPLSAGMWCSSVYAPVAATSPNQLSSLSQAMGDLVRGVYGNSTADLHDYIDPAYSGSYQADYGDNVGDQDINYDDYDYDVIA